jgi:hypothetical protein
LKQSFALFSFYLFTFNSHEALRRDECKRFAANNKEVFRQLVDVAILVLYNIFYSVSANFADAVFAFAERSNSMGV